MTIGQERQPDRGRIVFGILLTLLFCFLTVSLATYSPLDRPGSVLHSPKPSYAVQNACGSSGAACAALFVRFCGFGAWFLLIPFFLRLVSFWTRRKLSASILKTFGAALTLIAVSGLASTFLPNLLNGAFSDSGGRLQTFMIHCQSFLAERQTDCGPGGELGAMTRFLLDQHLHLAPLGILIFLSFTFIAGIILACDWSFLRFLLMITGILTLAEILLGVRKQKKSSSDLTDAADEAETLDDEDSPWENPPDETTEESERDHKPPDAENEESGESGENGEEESARNGFLSKTAETENERKISSSADPSGLNLSRDPLRDESRPYLLPSIEILDENPPSDMEWAEVNVEAQGRRLQKAFADFKCLVRVRDHQSGPVITLFELELAKGLRLSQIQGLSYDLAIAMKVPSVRIVAPIPGKNTVGVEIPNTDRQLVRLREVMIEGSERAKKMDIPLFIGKDVTGDPLITDLSKLPHLLIAGRTGTGKSVCLNSIILSILMTRTPDEVRLILIDPKMVELSPYKTVPHLMHPVVTDMKKAAAILGWAVEKMEERYSYLARAGVRQLKEYNRLTQERLRQRMQPESDEEWGKIPKKLPAIVIIADEMADMMMVAGKDVQEHIARLAQKSRAVGIYLVLATQKPTVDVVTGLIKSNLPARIAFGVATQSDSRVVIDSNGADQLLGNGDLLFLDSVTNQIIRGQGTFVSGQEIDSVICEISVEKPDFVKIDFDNSLFEDGKPDLRQNEDPLYKAAVELVVSERRGSTSLLQRRFSIGYGRAAKIIDAMQDAGIIGPKTENDSKPRKVLITLDAWRVMCERDEEPPIETPPFPSLAPEYRKLPSQSEPPKRWDDMVPDEFDPNEEDDYDEEETAQGEEYPSDWEDADEEFADEEFIDDEMADDELAEEEITDENDDGRWDADGAERDEIPEWDAGGEEVQNDHEVRWGAESARMTEPPFDANGAIDDRFSRNETASPKKSPPNLREMADQRRRKKNRKRNKKKRRH